MKYSLTDEEDWRNRIFFPRKSENPVYIMWTIEKLLRICEIYLQSERVPIFTRHNERTADTLTLTGQKLFKEQVEIVSNLLTDFLRLYVRRKQRSIGMFQNLLRITKDRKRHGTLRAPWIEMAPKGRLNCHQDEHQLCFSHKFALDYISFHQSNKQSLPLNINMYPYPTSPPWLGVTQSRFNMGSTLHMHMGQGQ